MLETFMVDYLIAYGLYSLIIYLIIICEDNSGDPIMFSDNFIVKELYDRTEMNIFGCIVSSILLCILLPLIAIIRIIYLIFHIGRKN